VKIVKQKEEKPGSDLLGVRHVVVPRDVIDSIHAHLRLTGAAHCEGVGFWAGRLFGEDFVVEAAIVPPQTTGHMENGLAVVVSGDALFRMNVWLHENHMTTIAQVHSHPGDAYHSDTDNDYAIMTRTGGLSIVVPNFARDEFSLDIVVVHRLEPDGSWKVLSERDARDLIQIEG
jgi:proteasome lid subunit RPN8/RPN11